jgi:hypothetical protein
LFHYACWAVTTLAGSGVTGSVNGTGTAVGFYYPFGITVDSSGNVYVEDNGTIKKLTRFSENPEG